MRAIFTFLFLSMGYLYAVELAVLGDKNFPEENLTKEEVKAFYLNKRHFVNDERVLVMNLETDHELRLCFEKKILEKSRPSLIRYWRKAYYKGKRPPKVVSSIALLFSYFDKVTPSLGYSDLNRTIDTEFKVLFVIECDNE